MASNMRTMVPERLDACMTGPNTILRIPKTVIWHTQLERQWFFTTDTGLTIECVSPVT